MCDRVAWGLTMSKSWTTGTWCYAAMFSPSASERAAQSKSEKRKQNMAKENTQGSNQLFAHDWKRPNKINRKYLMLWMTEKGLHFISSSTNEQNYSPHIMGVPLSPQAWTDYLFGGYTPGQQLYHGTNQGYSNLSQQPNHSLQPSPWGSVCYCSIIKHAPASLVGVLGRSSSRSVLCFESNSHLTGVKGWSVNMIKLVVSILIQTKTQMEAHFSRCTRFDSFVYPTNKRGFWQIGKYNLQAAHWVHFEMHAC